jgi:hypothetical protein
VSRWSTGSRNNQPESIVVPLENGIQEETNSLTSCKEAPMTLSHESIDSGNPPYPFAPVLRADLLTRIHELNSDYLELLATERTPDECMGQLQYFAPRLKASFAGLSLEHRARLAATPYTLYSLRFEDVRFWQAASRTPRQPIEERYAVAPSGGSFRALFVEIAVLQAWHIANTHPLAARVLYSMGEAVRERVAIMPLWQVKHIVAERARILTPRWPMNPCFWPDLLAFAKTGDSARLAATQLLGTQLIAAELAAARTK